MLTSTLHTFCRVLGFGRRRPAYASSFGPTRPAGGQRLAGNVIFRMKAWPQLPESGRTAEIYRVLSVMSSQPVNRQWLLARCTMAPRDLDELLLKLVRDGALEVIDPSRFAGREAVRA
jgi:hypothetical protein